MIGVNEKGDSKNDIKRLFADVTAENFPNIRKETDIQIRKVC